MKRDQARWNESACLFMNENKTYFECISVKFGDGFNELRFKNTREIWKGKVLRMRHMNNYIFYQMFWCQKHTV